MNWNEASLLIQNSIHLGDDVNTPKSTFRFVQEIPPYQCKKYSYQNEVGYKVKIGGTTVVEIPMGMLETLFNLSVENNRTYNSKIFKKSFPVQAKDHGCHVHVVGRIFELSGVARKSGSDYEIL